MSAWVFCFLKSVTFSDCCEIKLSFPDLMFLRSGPRLVPESSLFSEIWCPSFSIAFFKETQLKYFEMETVLDTHSWSVFSNVSAF